VSRAEAVYETFPGWSEPLGDVRRYDDLPGNARRYLERIEAVVQVPIDVISIGPGRDETIARRDPFAHTRPVQ
jgi:adenylosuccinate synthase